MSSPYALSFITLFPDLFPGPLAHSITGRALKAGLWQPQVVDIRAFAKPDNHKTVDDTPYGGGAGMVLRADVVVPCVRAARAANPGAKVAYLSAAGRPFTTAMAKTYAQADGLILLCGHYEGIDQRAIELAVDDEVCVADAVYTGGEIPALLVADAVLRQIPGVLGKAESLADESFEHGLLEAPHYTRPEVYEGLAVPPVLKSGNHAEIARWRQAQAMARTAARRQDLAQAHKTLAPTPKIR